MNCSQIPSWLDCLKSIVQRGDPEAHFRGMLVIENMMSVDYDICAKICQSQLLEVSHY